MKKIERKKNKRKYIHVILAVTRAICLKKISINFPNYHYFSIFSLRTRVIVLILIHIFHHVYTLIDNNCFLIFWSASNNYHMKLDFNTVKNDID